MDIERHDTYIALFLLRMLDGDMSWRGEEVKKRSGGKEGGKRNGEEEEERGLDAIICVGCLYFSFKRPPSVHELQYSIP